MAATQAGVGAQFHLIHAAAVRMGLYPRVYNTSVMYAPPSRRTRCLFTVWTYPQKDGRVGAYVSAEGIQEFYGRSKDQVTAALGGTGWLALDQTQVSGFAAGIEGLFSEGAAPDGSGVDADAAFVVTP